MPDSQRGLHRLKTRLSGDANWIPAHLGRLSGPLAISPYGGKVASLTVSRWGDGPKVFDISAPVCEAAIADFLKT